MVTPTIRGQTTPAAGGSASSPAGTQVGDLVCVFTWERAGAGVPTHTIDTGNGYVEIRTHGHNDGSTDGALSAGYKIATVAGAQTYQSHTTSTGSPEWWTGLIVLTRGTFDVSTLPISTSLTQTTNAVPDPADVTGLTAATNYLMVAIAAWHLGSSLTNAATAPTNYINLSQVAGAATGDLACATRVITGATSENPGVWGDDQAPNGTASMTIAFAGADSVSKTPPVAAPGLVLTGVAPTVRWTLTPPVGALAMAGVAPTVTEATGAIAITPPVGSLALAGVAPSLLTDFARTPPVGALAMAGVAPTLGLGTVITPPVGVVYFGLDVVVDTPITPTVGALALAGVAPTLTQDTGRTPPVGAVALTGVAPAVTRQDSITPPAGALTLTGVAPTVFRQDAITPPVGSLALAGVAPALGQELSITSPVGSLALTGVAPTVLVSVAITPPVGALAVTGVAPTLFREDFVTPPVAAVALVGVAPTVTETSPGNDNIIPATGSLALTGTVSTWDLGVEAGAGSLALSGAAPTLFLETVVIPPAGSLTFVGTTPLRITDTGLTPPAGQVTLAGVTPTVLLPRSITPQAGALEFAGYAPGAEDSGTPEADEGTMLFHHHYAGV